MYCEKINFKEYKNLKETFSSFIIDEQWLNTILIDSLLNEEIKEETAKMINFFKNNPKPNDVNDYLTTLREKSVSVINVASKNINHEDAWFLSRQAYAYYALGEIITEGSAYSEDLANELKNEFGNDYLEVLQKIDNYNPSELTKFNKLDKIDIELTKECVEKYLILKKWQDNQNIYHYSKLYPIFEKKRDNFLNFYKDNFEKLDCGARELLILYKLRKCNLIKIDTIAMFIDIGMESELASIIGGKNYGLGVLKSYDLNIPLTYIIPVGQAKNISNYDIFSNEISYAVRSSANCEDGEKNSFAGMFDSYLNVKREDLITKINNVINSTNNSRLKAYLNKFNLTKPDMSIVIQEFISAEISGVWLGKTKETGILEWVKGCGDQLVSGKVTPITEKFDNKNSNKDALTINNIKIGDILLQYQKIIGNICDFEWCIKNNKLYMLQYRPVTEIIEDNETNEKYSVKGTPASKGLIEGEICFLEEVDEIESFEPNSILLTYYTDPDWVEIMTKAKAIITSEGGFLCHTAIIARELGIPCVTGIGEENLLFLSKFKKIKVNGNTGGIDPIE